LRYQLTLRSLGIVHFHESRRQNDLTLSIDTPSPCDFAAEIAFSSDFTSRKSCNGSLKLDTNLLFEVVRRLTPDFTGPSERRANNAHSVPVE
jgi:hypothetical protein